MLLTNKTTKTGQKLYFIGYSNMKYKDIPLLILATDPTNKNTYGHYTMEANFNVIESN